MTLREQFEPARLMRVMLMMVLGLLAIFIEAAPLGFSPTARPSPDLLLGVVAFWSIRRPGSTPILAVFTLGLLRDLLTDVPVGAGALSLVLVSEVLRMRRRRLELAPFLIEWFWVSAAALLSTALVFVLVVLMLVQPPYLMDLLHQVIFTAMAYPPLVLVFRWVLRIGWRRPEPA